ncbi:MAG: tyrosine--tRNA ligase [Lentisphaerae bacterium]|nr:tyrosine--tRNA ligase [Lentisphaerota bacterium]
MQDPVAILRARGLLEDVTSPAIHDLLREQAVVYAGFDPTADSLQAGNVVTIMALAHFQRCGHRVVALVGGATGMIGDPSGKSEERRLLSAEDVAHNAEGIRENLSRYLDFEHDTAPAAIVNNADWLKDYPFIGFLRDVGKHFRMGTMLGKESVRARLNSETGMSFAEFSYQLLQAYDFLVLFDREQCRLQIGGSDQWGNITAGIDLIRKQRGTETFGLTVPLVCDSAGRKFGKSEGNAIYLDPAKTSYYDFYQFFLRTADADVIRFLKIFTFLPTEDIAALETAVRDAPEKRAAQQRLAEEATRLAHGETGLDIARRASAVMFGASMDGLHARDLLNVFAHVPSTELPPDAVQGRPVADVAVAAGLCGSKGEARRLAAQGGLYLNNRRVGDAQAVLENSDVIDGRLVVLRSGKKQFRLVKVV